MKKVTKIKLMALASAALVAIPMLAQAGAVSVTVTANFRRAISINPGTNLDFNKIDYSATAVTATDYVTVGTNGAAVYHGNWAAGTGAATTAGDVQVVTGDAIPVWVECSSTAVLANGANTIQATGIEVTNTGYGAYGTANACKGITTNAFGFTLTGGGADHIKVGGKLDGSTASGGTIASGAYSTANSGGTPISVNVYYQ